MKKICLSIDQMLQLKELGVEIKDASMCWVRDPEGNYSLSLHDEYCYEMSFMNPVPAFTLQDMIDELPKRFQFKMEGNCGRYCDLEIQKLFNGWNIMYTELGYDVVHLIESESLLDAAFDMLVWLAKHGYLKGGRESEEMKEQTGSTNASGKSQN